MPPRYDDMTDDEQATERARWESELDVAREGLDLEAIFRAADRSSWVSCDEHGNVIVVRPDT